MDPIFVVYWCAIKNLHTQKQQQQQQQQHLFNFPLSGTSWMSQYQKGTTNVDLLQQETVSGNGISWAICESAPHPRKIIIPAPTTLFFTGQMPFLPPNQQCQSTEGSNLYSTVHCYVAGLECSVLLMPTLVLLISDGTQTSFQWTLKTAHSL